MPGLLNALALFAATVTGPVPSGPAPIRLVVETAGEGVRLKVIGAADEVVDATYSLQVTGGRGSNRSLQRGTARLRPGAPVTLVTLTLGNADAGWSALLKVSPEPGAPYEQTEGSRAGRQSD